MTTLEKAAKAVCENLFGPFDPTELESPSSVSAQSMMAVRAAIEALKNSRMLERTWNDAAPTTSNWNKALDTILNEKEG